MLLLCLYEELLLAAIDVTCSLRSLSKHAHHFDHNCVCPSTETQASLCRFGTKRSDARMPRGGSPNLAKRDEIRHSIGDSTAALPVPGIEVAYLAAVVFV